MPEVAHAPHRGAEDFVRQRGEADSFQMKADEYRRGLLRVTA
jgi:hypothetical protein